MENTQQNIRAGLDAQRAESAGHFLGALDRVEPAQVLAIAQALLGRIGVGDVPRAPEAWATAAVARPIALTSSCEPSKYDDHQRDDSWKRSADS